MTQTFTSHARENYERTAQALNEIEGLTYALDIAMDQISTEDSSSAYSTRAVLAKDTILRLLIEKVGGIQKLRSMEWVGLGGNSHELTPDEIAVARGEAV